MSCDTWIEALSARADGEDPGIDLGLLDAHVARCADCRSYAADLDGSAQVRVVESVDTAPDLSRRIAKLAAVADRGAASVVARLALAAIAIVIGVGALPQLVLGEDGMEHGTSHLARHVGAFSVAFAVGLLVVVARPARARTMLPVAFVVAAALAITAVLDATEGRVTFIAEGKHLPELCSVVLLWILARPSASTDVRSESRSADLRLVRDDDTARREAG